MRGRRGLYVLVVRWSHGGFGPCGWRACHLWPEDVREGDHVLFGPAPLKEIRAWKDEEPGRVEEGIERAKRIDMVERIMLA